MDPANCILVQDVKDALNDQITQNPVSTQSPTEGKWISVFIKIDAASQRVIIGGLIRLK